jgi:hypothetical protein
MPNVIEAVVDAAMEMAATRGARADAAIGIVAALRRIRATLEEEVGYAPAAAMDSTLHDLVISYNLRHLSETRQEPEPTALPEPGPDAVRASAIFEDAARNCIAFNTRTPDNSCLHQAICLLADRLFRLLGGTPAAADLIGRLRGGEALHEVDFIDPPEDGPHGSWLH